MPIAEATAVFSPEAGTRKPEARRETDRSVIRHPQPTTRHPIVLEHDPFADRAALEALALWCEQFSPCVGLEDAPQPQCLLLDVTGLAPLFGGEDLLAERAQRALIRRGFAVRMAIADTIGAAWAAAKYAVRRAESGIEANESLREPAFLIAPLIIPPDGTLASIGSLPIQGLRLPDETIAILEKLGICEIGQLAALPKSSLAARFGPLMINRLNQAFGTAEELIVAHHAPPEFQAEWLLEYATDRQEMIHFAIETLIGRVATMLAARGRGALELECRLGCQASPPVEVRVGLFRPMASAKHLWQLVCLRLERVRLSAPVEVVNVAVLRTAPLEIRQQSLFEEGSRASDQRQVGLLVNRLSNRLSREAVLRPHLVADAQPEFAFRYRMLTESTQRSRQRERSGATPAPGDRPLWVHARPLPLEVMSVAPGGKPVRFRFQKGEYQRSRTWGPERIETGWWRGRYIRRDYYKVETTRGERFWIFRRLADRQWFLQGEDG